MRRDAVDFVVGRHHAYWFGFFDYFFERVKECFAQDAFRDICRRAVHAGFGLAVSGEVFERSHYMFAVVEFSVALEAFYYGYSHARDQVGIFSVGFFAASPAWVADYVYRSEEHTSELQ